MNLKCGDYRLGPTTIEDVRKRHPDWTVNLDYSIAEQRWLLVAADRTIWRFAHWAGSDEPPSKEHLGFVLDHMEKILSDEKNRVDAAAMLREMVGVQE